MKKLVYYSRLRELAEKHPKVKDMSQGEIAGEVGVSRQTINRWFDENEYFDVPPYITAKRLAELLDTTTDALFGTKEIDTEQLGSSERKLEEVFAGL